MSGLKAAAEAGSFEVDLAWFAPGWKVFRPRAFVVDPALVASVLTAALPQGQRLDARRRPIYANHFTLVMHPVDFDQLMQLRVRLHRDIGPVLAEAVRAGKADVVGPLVATFVPDESGRLVRGWAALRGQFLEVDRLPGEVAGEVTVRFDDPVVATPVTPVVPALSAPDAVTLAPPGARLSWPGGRAELTSGVRYVLGRPHDGPPRRFVALAGAGSAINRQQAWIEVGDDGVRIGRFADANPVVVRGRPVQPGGELAVAAGEVELVLSQELRVMLETSA